MCLIFLSLNQHPVYKLIIAANRDEFYVRKTAQASFWEDHPSIIGGRDLEASGTWMAMNKNGRISLVTNYRDPANINPHAPSRGQLVSNYLTNEETPSEYLISLLPNMKQYNGFNLLVGSANELWYLSNYKTGIQKLESGIYGLSNHLLDTPWPKVERGKKNFKDAVSMDNFNGEVLFELLHDDQRAADSQLPETGVGLERERALSAMFIKMKGYGTRCSTVVLVDKQNRVLYSERTYHVETFKHKTQSYSFQITE
ncbi:MAG: NRDE family protein [Cyclobacteriaceae bacterium]|nr:NRDE family protein [Cyclobacteriaceae bacterium]